jgi:nucleotide-binding universal stress UspA family protein
VARRRLEPPAEPPMPASVQQLDPTNKEQMEKSLRWLRAQESSESKGLAMLRAARDRTLDVEALGQKFTVRYPSAMEIDRLEEDIEKAAELAMKARDAGKVVPSHERAGRVLANRIIDYACTLPKDGSLKAKDLKGDDYGLEVAVELVKQTAMARRAAEANVASFRQVRSRTSPR